MAAGVPLLVGRDEEIGLLRRRWDQSKAGQGQVVCISGEAGIGKSALVEALRAQVRAEGLPRIAVRCSPYHTNSALYPVITHFEHLLQFAADDPPATKLAKLEEGLRPSGLPLAEVVPLFAGLLSVPLPAERYAPLTLTPQQQKQQTLDALVAWLAAEAERQPVLVAWEDLHWADPTTLELLGLVIEQAPTVPMLHVLTYRPEFSPPWPPRSHITPLVLNRLERPQVEALIAQRAGGKTTAGRGGAVHRGQNGWGATVCRRADQDAAGVAAAAGRGGPVCAHRAAAHSGDSGHPPGCPHGPPRSAQSGERGGIARRGAGAGVCL